MSNGPTTTKGRTPAKKRSNPRPVERAEGQKPDRPQNKTLRPNPHTLGQTPLAEGEASIRVYVRGPSAALAWFEGLSKEERGQLVATLWNAECMKH